MSLSIASGQKTPLGGVSVKYGVSTEAAVRGVVLSIDELACFASLDAGRWRYWLRQVADDDGDGLADRIGRLVALKGKEFMGRLNDHSAGPLAPVAGKPSGEAVVYDLADGGVVGRFALACAVGEALSRSRRLRFSRLGRPWATAKAFQDALPRLNANVALWGLEAPPDGGLVFFPDAILLRLDRHQWVIPYAEISVRRGTPSPEGEHLTLALSDQRVRLLVSDSGCAERAASALERLIAFEAKRRAHLGPRPSVASERLKRREASVGKIVVKPKEGGPVAEKVVIDLPEPERPGPCPDDGGLATMVAEPVEDLVFCDDSGLVFTNEAPSTGSDFGPVEDAAEPAPPRRPVPPPPPRPVPPPPPVRRPPPSGRPGDGVRMAVGALLSYVAKTDQGFGPAERAVIREILQLPRALSLEQRFSAVRPGSRALQHALGVLRRQPPAVRQQALRSCERVAAADGEVTVQEHARLTELRQALI